jgi:hypothetical protein
MTRISKTSSDPRAVHSKIFQFSEGKNPLEATITPDRPAVQRERGLRECPLLRKQRTLKVRSLKPAFDPNRPSSLFSSVYGLATTRQHSCNGNCEILVTAETFGLTIDVTRNGGEITV